MTGAQATTAMTKAERADLCTLIRRREKIEKTATAQRAAELRSDFEAQLAAIYSFDQEENWKAAHAAAEAAEKAGNQAILKRCKELGIPKEFAPSISCAWYGRGENSTSKRRAELRQVAVTRIAALEKQARTAIEKRSVELQEEVIVNGITSDAALSFLAKLPKVQDLMPVIEVRSLFKDKASAQLHQLHVVRPPERE